MLRSLGSVFSVGYKRHSRLAGLPEDMTRVYFEHRYLMPTRVSRLCVVEQEIVLAGGDDLIDYDFEGDHLAVLLTVPYVADNGSWCRVIIITMQDKTSRTTVPLLFDNRGYVRLSSPMRKNSCFSSAAIRYA